MHRRIFVMGWLGLGISALAVAEGPAKPIIALQPLGEMPAKDVAAFQDEMRKSKADYVFVGYAGAVHAFTQKEAGNDNSKGAAYNEAAHRRSWDHMKAFFAEIF